jgi:hypothetical protein
MTEPDDENSIPRPDGAADRQISVSKAPPPIRPLTGRVRAERPTLGYTAAASLRADDPHPTIPPDWLQLADASCWIDRVHGVRSEAITRDLFLAVRSKLEIPHRVWCEWRYRHGSLILPPGLAYGSPNGTQCIYVSNWEVAGADRTNCTVDGWKQDDGTPERLTVDVPWEAVDRFVRIRLPRWKREAADASKPMVSAPLSADPAVWMLAYARDQLDLLKVPAKRDLALKACRDATGCNYRQAYAAWMALSPTVKRKPRESDRALTGR